MKLELTPRQNEYRDEFAAFVDEEVAPQADGNDAEERTPPELIRKLARRGYLGATLPADWGGMGLDMITFGLLNEELGRGCSSARSLLTVHTMVSQAIRKWGNARQKERWLPKLASGELVAAFALSEPEVGSDASGVQTSAVSLPDSYVLDGRKRWVTYGQIADLFLVFAQSEGKVSAFLVERDRPGFSVEPVYGMLGLRASMTADLRLAGCRVPKENMLGRMGAGFTFIASSALDEGRYSVACGCLGIAEACLQASARYVNERKQFGVYLREHQLIQQMMANMLTGVKAARLLCRLAGYLKDAGEPSALMETMVAKYFASTNAYKAATDAVQIHGANGCSSAYAVQRYLRDAKIMEIIEGSTQMQQITIGKYAAEAFAPVQVGETV
jgi:alkylation response protein AidB-like acyl-CoA dehydrogenase